VHRTRVQSDAEARRHATSATAPLRRRVVRDPRLREVRRLRPRVRSVGTSIEQPQARTTSVPCLWDRTASPSLAPSQ
jgi:hypothetical protein